MGYDSEWAARRLIDAINKLSSGEADGTVRNGTVLAITAGLDNDACDGAVSEAAARDWVERLENDRLRLTRPGRESASSPPPLLPSPLRKAARSLRAPTGAAFDASAWQALLGSDLHTLADMLMIATAIWLNEQSRNLRVHSGAVDHARLGADMSTLLAVAALNRDFHKAHRKQIKSLRRAMRASPHGEVVDIDGVSAQPLRGRDGQLITLDDWLDAAGDAIESWLYDATKAAASAATPALTNDLDFVGEKGLLYYSLQHGLNHLWQQALWGEWFFNPTKGRLFWSPWDRRLALLFAAWQTRNRSNAFQYPQIARLAWRTRA